MSGDIAVFLGKDCCREGNWMTDRICRLDVHSVYKTQNRKEECG